MSPAARAPLRERETTAPAPAKTVEAPTRSSSPPSSSAPPPLRLVRDQRPAEPQREESLGDSILWGLVREYAPDLEPIMRRGVFAWLEEQITAAIGSLVDSLFAPVRAFGTAASSLSRLFQSLVEWMQEAAAKIAKGDCSSLTEAAEKIEQVVSGILSAVVDRAKALAQKVRDFFTGLWNRFGAPVWEMLKSIGGAAWERIQALGRWIWDKTEPVRRFASHAWKWIKDRLGVGEGPEGQNGLLQWVQAKAAQAWEWLKPRIEPYKKQLMVIAGIALALSPAGPLLAMGAGIVGMMYGIRWIRQHLRNRADIIAQRGVLKGVIIPGLMRGVETVAATLKASASRVSGKLGELVGALGHLAGGLADSLLSVATRIVEWIAEQAQRLLEWATEKVEALVHWVTTTAERLRAYLQPVLDVLNKVAEIYLDILKIPLLVATKAWHKIPACIREPFVNFLINQVVKRIPLFQQVTEVLPAMWQKIKTTALEILRKVFKEGDLKGAALIIFKLLLNALEVPLELITMVITKGLNSIDLILDKPVAFLSNMLGALKQGFFQFGQRIIDHLLGGLKEWLFGAATKAGIKPPTELSFRAIFDFILQLLDVTVEKVLERLEKRIGPQKTAVIRKALTVMSKVWEWLSTLFNEGPEGVWRKLKEKLGDLWQTVLNSAVGYMIKTVTKIAIEKVLATIAGGPVGVVVNGIIAIWKALQTFAKYLKRILEIMNVVFDTIADIARGAIGGAANLIESAMSRTVPIVLAFLANQVGLGDLSERLQAILEKIREKVAEAIDWLIDKALAIGGAVLGLVKAGIAKVTEWWKAAKTFMSGGKEHTIKFHGEGPDATLMVESTPLVLEDFLATLPKPTTDEEKDALKAIKAQKAIIDKIKADNKGSFGPTAGKLIMDALEEIAKHLPKLGRKVPRSEVDWTEVTVLGDDVGQTMVASPLSIDPGGHAGSQPFEESELWKAVNRRPMTYVQGHLLNHHVHGPGAKFNLAPITRSANTKMETTFEHYVKKAVIGDAKVVEYKVTVKFGKQVPKRLHIAEENQLPLAVEFEGWEMDQVGSKWKPNKAKSIFPTKPYVIENDLGPDLAAGLTQETVNLSEDTPSQLAKHPHITPDMAQRIRRVRLKRVTPFHVYEDLKDAGLTDAEVAALAADKFVTLR